MRPSGSKPVSELIQHIKNIAQQFRVKVDDCLPWSVTKTLGSPSVTLYIDSPSDFDEIGASAGVCIEVNEDFLSHEGDKSYLHLTNDKDLENFIQNLQKALDTSRAINRKLYAMPGISHLE